MNKIPFAIVGCGRIAQRHAQHIKHNGTLVAVCDTTQEKAETLGKAYEAKAFTDLTEMLNRVPEIEVVAVCTPNGLHAVHTITAFKAGKHVICEKPMAINPYDCGEMIKDAEKANRRLFIIKQNRFNPPVAAVKQLIDEGKLGRLYSMHLSCYWNRNPEYYQDSWKGSKALDGGTLYTQFSHFIDLLYWMFGDVKEVTAFVSNYHHQGIIEFEDTGVVSLQFYSGAIGSINYTVNAHTKNMEGSLTIFGEKGTVKIGGQYLNELEYQQIEGHTIENLPPGNPPNQYGHYVGSMSNHDQVYKNVVEVLSHHGIIATNGFEGLKTVEIIDKIYTAAKWL